MVFLFNRLMCVLKLRFFSQSSMSYLYRYIVCFQANILMLNPGVIAFPFARNDDMAVLFQNRTEMKVGIIQIIRKQQGSTIQILQPSKILTPDINQIYQLLRLALTGISVCDRLILYLAGDTKEEVTLFRITSSRVGARRLVGAYLTSSFTLSAPRLRM